MQNNAEARETSQAILGVHLRIQYDAAGCSQDRPALEKLTTAGRRRVQVVIQTSEAMETRRELAL